MPQPAAPNPIVNAPKLSQVQQAIAQIPGPATRLMVMPPDLSLVPLTDAVTFGPSGEIFYTVIGYFDFVTLTYTPV